TCSRTDLELEYRTLGASLPGMEWSATSIYASEALLAYVILADGLTEELGAIRPIDRCVERYAGMKRKSSGKEDASRDPFQRSSGQEASDLLCRKPVNPCRAQRALNVYEQGKQVKEISLAGGQAG